MDLALAIFGAAVAWFVLFYLPMNSCATLAPEKGRRVAPWVLGAFFTGPLALVLVHVLPRLVPTPEELYVEVWRMGVQRAERAVLAYFACPEEYAANNNLALERIVKAAIKGGSPHYDTSKILERRARGAGAYALERIDEQAVRRLAEALAMDPDEAIASATRTLRDPLRAVEVHHI